MQRSMLFLVVVLRTILVIGARSPAQARSGPPRAGKAVRARQSPIGRPEGAEGETESLPSDQVRRDRTGQIRRAGIEVKSGRSGLRHAFSSIECGNVPSFDLVINPGGFNSSEIPGTLPGYGPVHTIRAPAPLCRGNRRWRVCRESGCSSVGVRVVERYGD